MMGAFQRLVDKLNGTGGYIVEGSLKNNLAFLFEVLEHWANPTDLLHG